MKNWGSLKVLAENFLKEADTRKKFAERLVGFDNLDARGKFSKEERKFYLLPGIYIIGAPPSAGKTTFCLQWLAQLADRGEECIFISYEMRAVDLFAKMVSHNLFEKKRAGENVNLLSAVDVLKAGTANADVNSAVKELEGVSNLRIVDECFNSKDLVKKMHEFVKTIARPPVICLDYLQMVLGEEKTPRERLDSLLNQLRKFQNETGATLILISSFNRADYSQNESSFASFRESGNLEFTADCLLALEPARRDDDESKNDADRRERKNKIRAMRLSCLKSRHGELFECFFRYYAAHNFFEACRAEELFEESADSKTRTR